MAEGAKHDRSNHIECTGISKAKGDLPRRRLGSSLWPGPARRMVLLPHACSHSLDGPAGNRQGHFLARHTCLLVDEVPGDVTPDPAFGDRSIFRARSVAYL